MHNAKIINSKRNAHTGRIMNSKRCAHNGRIINRKLASSGGSRSWHEMGAFSLRDDSRRSYAAILPSPRSEQISQAFFERVHNATGDSPRWSQKRRLGKTQKWRLGKTRVATRNAINQVTNWKPLRMVQDTARRHLSHSGQFKFEWSRIHQKPEQRLGKTTQKCRLVKKTVGAERSMIPHVSAL